jgi:cell pole-organizing protein PopZ
MEDVLASIRRILSEEGQQPASTVPAPADKSDGVLVLDTSMMVADERADTTADVSPQPRTEPAPETPPSSVAPEAAASAPTAMGNLLRTVTTDPSLKVRPGGDPIEDIVRDELRLLLKNWLDAHLAETVERLVRAEVERVVGRSVP